jgi:hypothetical protein
MLICCPALSVEAALEMRADVAMALLAGRARLMGRISEEATKQRSDAVFSVDGGIDELKRKLGL